MTIIDVIWFRPNEISENEKKVEKWSACHSWRIKDVAMKFWKVVYLYTQWPKTSFQRLQSVYTMSGTSYRHLTDVETTSCVYRVKALGNGLNQFSLYSAKARKGMAYRFHRKCCEIKRTVPFERLVELKWNFVGIWVFMRDFSKVIVLPNHRKNYLKIQRLLRFRCQRYGHQTLKMFDLNGNFPRLT